MGLCTDRAHSGPATAVGDAESLVQVQVGHVAANIAVTCVAHQRVEVGAVDIDLAASLVDRVGDIFDAVLIHTVGGRVGDHQRSEIVAVFCNLCFQVIDVDIALVITRHDHDLHSGENSAGGVGAVRAGRNQTHRPMVISAGEVVSTDCQKARILPLASRIGLE